ncbi:hypothetical protein BD779DRAFT_1716779 [Infundibulicybe gibba]|nr:hypothetical protein BD779DRAFT_1716779 [Infundibulicybe gibba]
MSHSKPNDVSMSSIQTFDLVGMVLVRTLTMYSSLRLHRMQPFLTSNGWSWNKLNLRMLRGSDYSKVLPTPPDDENLRIVAVYPTPTIGSLKFQHEALFGSLSRKTISSDQTPTRTGAQSFVKRVNSTRTFSTVHLRRTTIGFTDVDSSSAPVTANGSAGSSGKEFLALFSALRRYSTGDSARIKIDKFPTPKARYLAAQCMLQPAALRFSAT